MFMCVFQIQIKIQYAEQQKQKQKKIYSCISLLWITKSISLIKFNLTLAQPYMNDTPFSGLNFHKLPQISISILACPYSSTPKQPTLE